MPQNIQQFFADLIELPKWIENLPYNSPVVMAFCVNQFIEREFSQDEVKNFYNPNFGTTPNDLVAYFKNIGLEIERPATLTHQIIKEGLGSGIFTFLAYQNGQPNMSFVRFYDPYLDKFLLFDFNFELLELDDLNIVNYFTLNTD